MEKDVDKEIMNFSIELARQGIDLEKLMKDLEPVFDVVKEATKLAVKNYNFMKGIKND